MSLLRPSQQLGVSNPNQPMQTWSEAAEDDDRTKRAHSDSVNEAIAGQSTFKAGKTPQSKFDGYLSDSSQESSACEHTVKAATDNTQPSRRKYLNRHVSTELESAAMPEPTTSDWKSSVARPSWSTISRRLSLSTATNRFARAPAEVPSSARATGASLSIHRPYFDETRRHTSWIGTIKMKLTGRGRRRDKLGDQATTPITRDCNFEDIPTVRSDEMIEGASHLNSAVSPSQPEPVSVYPRLRSQPSLNRLASARQRHTSARRNVLSGAHSHVADVIFVPEESDTGEEYMQGTSLPYSNRAQRRSQFILPHRRSLTSEDKSPYTKIDEFDNAY
ncbi:hypothetical protein GGI01_000173 [Coemansia sp. RSA 376]|nr:hypothetical protein IW146_001573 [Coemansia sp. RSA 922]KAJ2264154.1 hypothetical protein GGI01_000173 [Coemansia sp. RSA 376]KAJ2468059.1 hypothetical protein GGI03_001225 [Coemansia sp. RSA 2337]